jgi:hypothetical protein
MNNTSPEIAAMAHAKLMAHFGAERFRLGMEMFEAAPDLRSRNGSVSSSPE